MAAASVREHRPGATDAELLAAIDRSPNSVRPRRVELAEDGLVTALRDEHGQEVQRAGSTVWVLTPAGAQVAEALLLAPAA